MEDGWRLTETLQMTVSTNMHVDPSGEASAVAEKPCDHWSCMDLHPHRTKSSCFAPNASGLDSVTLQSFEAKKSENATSGFNDFCTFPWASAALCADELTPACKLGKLKWWQRETWTDTRQFVSIRTLAATDVKLKKSFKKIHKLKLKLKLWDD